MSQSPAALERQDVCDLDRLAGLRRSEPHALPP